MPVRGYDEMVVMGFHQPSSAVRSKGRHPVSLAASRGPNVSACASHQSVGVKHPADRHPGSLMAYGGQIVELELMVHQLVGVESPMSRHPEGFAAPWGPLRMVIWLVHQPVG